MDSSFGQSQSPALLIGGIVCYSCNPLGSNASQIKLSFAIALVARARAWRLAGGNANLVQVSGKPTKSLL